MKRLKQKQFRILFLFILGIAIPSLLLGYLAFRGIRNDQALLEREKRRDLQNLADTITGKIENKIFQTERSFIELVAEVPATEISALNQTLTTFKEQNPLVKDPFILETERGIQLPAAKLLYLPDGSVEALTSPSLPSDLSKIYFDGQEAEFQQKNFPKALSLYRQAFNLASDRRAKGELLNAVARVQKKSALFQEALDTYQIIAKEYGQERLLSGVSLGIAVNLEVGSLYLLLDNPLSAGQTLVDLFETLLQGVWILERAQYSYFVPSLKGSLDGIFSQSQVSPELESLKKNFQQLAEAEKEQIERTEKLTRFPKKKPPRIYSLDWLKNPDGHKTGQRELLWRSTVTLF